MVTIMTSGYPKPHVIEPSGTHTHTIIFLHGRGSSGKELAEDLGQLGLSKPRDGDNIFSQYPNVRWVFPSAKSRYSTVFQEEITEWFDIHSLSNPSEKFELQIEGLAGAVKHLRYLVDEEVRRVGQASQIILAGISLGEATALTFLLTSNYNFGSFIGASGWIPVTKEIHGILRDELVSKASITETLLLSLRQALGLDLHQNFDGISFDTRTTSVFLGHGTDDAFVDIKLGLEVRDILGRIGYQVEWYQYEGAEQEGHWLKEPEEIDDICRFVDTILGVAPDALQRVSKMSSLAS
ncbi:hypothetical protein ABW19_dt0200654 [Dactylella cylindrospora]|nr:hypothetical protein ABW19_dt0200654 [Dactylella cylindrospora]